MGASKGPLQTPSLSFSLPTRTAILLLFLLLHVLLPAPARSRGAAAVLAARRPPPLPCSAAAPAGNGTPWRWERGGAPLGDTAFGPLELTMSNCPTLPAHAWRSPPTCLGGRHVLFAGDSTMRQQFLNLIKALESGSWEVHLPASENMQRIDPPSADSSGMMHDWFRWSATQPPHVCDCVRCEGNFVFEHSSDWTVEGLSIACSMENRYYLHGPSGTRVTFLLLLGRAPMAWNGLSFLGVDPCFGAAAAARARNASAACPQRGCGAGACYPPARAAPPLRALEERLRELKPDEVVLSAGPWGSWEDDAWLAEAVAALRRGGAGASGGPRVWWRTPNFPAPGSQEMQGAFHYPRARTPRVEAAFQREGWGVIDAGGLLASAMVFDARAAGLPRGAWPFAEAHPAAQAAAEASLRGDPRLAELPAQKVAVMTDWMHPSAWWLRHLNTQLLAHLCAA